MADEMPGSSARDARSAGGVARPAAALAGVRARLAPAPTAIAFALLAAAVGFGLRWLIDDPGPRFIVLYPTVALVALLAGPLAGLVATAAVAVAMDFFYFPPIGSLLGAARADAASLATFVLTGILVSLIATADRAVSAHLLTVTRKSEAADARHRTVFETLLEGVLVFGSRAEILSANPSAERLLGLSLKELQETYRDLSAWPLYDEDGRRLEPDALPLAVVLRTGTTIQNGLVELRAGQQGRWFVYNAAPIVDDGDRVTAVVMSFTDVTERRRAEREIASGRERLKTLFSVLNEGVVVFAPDGRVLAHNPSAERILGHPPGALADHPPGYVDWRLLHPDGTPMEHAEFPIVRVFTTGEPVHNQLLGVQRSDGVVWLLNNADPMFDPVSGEVASIVVSFADITELRRVEQELAESRARLATVFDALHEAVMVFAPSGRVVSANAACETVLRRPLSALIDRPGFMALGRRAVREDGSDFPVDERPIPRALTLGAPARDVVIGVHDETGLFWLLVNAEPIFEPGTDRVGAVVASYTDITRRRQRETELAESRAHFASIFAAVHEAILTVTPDRRVRSWNDSAVRLLRLDVDRSGTLDEIFANRPLLQEDESPMPLDEMPALRTLRTGEAVHGVVVGMRLGTQTFWFFVNSEPIRDAETGAVSAVVMTLNEVTERRAARQDLIESRARLASIVASAMDAILSIDEDQRIVLFNPAAERIFGWSEAEVVGRPVSILAPERHRESHERGLRDFARSGEQTWKTGDRRPITARRADGREFPFEASISRVEVTGRPLYNIVLRDLSERVAAERTNARLATLVRSSPDAIFTVSLEGRILTWNDAATRVLGYTEAQAIGLPVAKLSYPGGDNDVASIFLRVKGGEPVKVEAVRRRADGSPVEVLASAAPIRDSSGRVVAVAVILSDISDSKQKERQLAERDEELRQTLDAAGLGVWWLDTATRVVHCDPRSRALFGVGENETAEALADRLHPDDRAAFMALGRDLGDEGTRRPVVVRRPVSDRDVAWLSVTARHRRTSDGSDEIWGTVQDVSEAQRAEEAMRRFEASRRLEALGRMTGGIAHDLNNLLTVVSGNLQLLEMSPGSEAASRWISEALRASESGAALNNRLLTFARRRRLTPDLTDINDLVAGMVDMLHRSVGPGIAIATMLGADLGRVRIDSSEIENAVLNLVLNARDAMPNGGRILIETANAVVEPSAEIPEDGVRAGSYVRLSVSDSGHGMAPEVKARAFEPFFTTKDVGRGSGLGLATLHGFVGQSGGFVSLYSEPGRGTVVHVHLPCVEAAEPSRPAAAVSGPHRGAGQRILLVDDDASVRRVTCERLQALGYEVESATDPAEARTLLAGGGRFDLVFTDIVMPGGVSGLDFARSLRAADPGCHVLVTSGFAEDFLGGPASAEIEFRFLRKPHSLAELASAVAEALAT